MEKKSYKDTLLIGKTDFEMKANLKTKEVDYQKEWLLNDIYKTKLAKNKKNKKFILHDGPPYANGNIHVGHALNKILKDFIVRWKFSNGYNSEYIMGWDTHGLPIESAIIKTKGINRKDLSPDEFRTLCKEYALEQVNIQTEQFKRLGIFTDYEKKYLTLNHNYEVAQLKLYAKMVEKNLVYRDFKPVYWSPTLESALAEAEIEYQDVRSASIYVSLKVIGEDNLNLIIWTTTPWTIPSNQLVAISEKIEYIKVRPQNSNEDYVIAENLLESAAVKFGWEKYDIKGKIKHHDLLGKEYFHPWFTDKKGKVVLGHHVTDITGTGMVHIAGGFGEDDFKIVKENNIKPFVPIDDQGKFTKEINDSKLEGIFYEDSNKIVGITLKEKGNLLKLEFLKHSYPHDWRSKKPVIYRATNQWFVNIEKIKTIIDKKILKNVETKPAWSKERLRNIIKERNDWTISRQRLWGVPIVAFFDKNNQPVMNAEIINYAISIIEQKGTNAWFVEPCDNFLPSKFKGQEFKKETDILDVWFDSGASNIVMREVYGYEAPFDVYLEGNDQYRGWFNSSMINSIIYDETVAYKFLITHGMTNDEKGKKMSKSIGNTIDPLKICDLQGADILRLWVCSTDYTDDQRIGDNILKQVGESYRKIRNTLRFLISNLFDFDPNKHYQKTLLEVDEFALNNLTLTKEKIADAFETYSFNNAYKLINNYVINDLSSFYLDFIKDILYVENADSLRRRQVQTVMYEQLWMLIDVLKPIIPHTTEEVYKNILFIQKEKSVHLLDLRKQDFKQKDKFVEKWNKFLKFRDLVNVALESARQDKIIRKGFEASLKVNLSDEFNFIKDIESLNQILIVNSIIFLDNQNEIKIEIEPKNGLKCERCWAIFDILNNDSICMRCESVVKNLNE
ncbi:isoleucine--tRNA ligase [Spiroplasma endosymbiont of Crioceris asparagi]|uniref:isoleucine--tRNA ligase n=1 Tax=Spiroplasma endosymbiont of Crioceris asparagi TaxID=3066286 RepID=UPI0030CDFE8D